MIRVVAAVAVIAACRVALPVPPVPPRSEIRAHAGACIDPAAGQVAAALEGAIAASVPPLGAEGEAGAFGDFGGERDRFGLSLVARTGIPQHAGGGRIREIAALAGATWRHQLGTWQARVELRGGFV